MKTKSKVKEFTTCKECKKSGWFTLSTNWQCPHCGEQSLEQYPTSKIHIVDANQYHGEKVGLIEKLLYVEQMAWNTEGSEISASTKKLQIV